MAVNEYFIRENITPRVLGEGPRPTRGSGWRQRVDVRIRDGIQSLTL